MPGPEQVVTSALRSAVSWLALLAEIVAIAIVAYAVLWGVWRCVQSLIVSRSLHPWGEIRLDLGRSLAVALEFLLAADVVRTAVTPSWDDIAKLGAIAVIRTGLNYFLQRDIEAVQSQEMRGRPLHPHD